MITEDYVSFEVAKLLKEKGFEGMMHTFYTDEGKEMESAYVVPSNFFPIYRPTLQMALKWLREVHNIHIIIESGKSNKVVYFSNLKNLHTNNFIYHNTKYHETYEEACEAAVKYCLENLI